MNLSPLPIQKFWGNNGRPLAGGLLFTYAAGTSDKIATYTDASGNSQNTNPIVLDFRGECRLWLDPQQAYKFILSPPGDTDPPTRPIWTVDDITAAPLPFDNAADDTGIVNNIELSIPWISSPVAFTRVVFKAANTNTGPTTLQINGGTAHALLWQTLNQFGGGEVQQGGVYQAIFDGAQWQLEGPTLFPTQMLQPAEIAASVPPLNFSYDPQDSLRYIPSGDVSKILEGLADLENAADVTTGIQNALTAYHYVTLPPGNYAISSSVVLRPWTILSGSGKSEYTVTLDEPVAGTRVFQTQADFAISTNTGNFGEMSAGRVQIRDITLLGGTTASQVGTYGIRAESSNVMLLERVKCEWFTLSGFRSTGSLLTTIRDSEFNYNQDAGIAFDFGQLGASQNSNSYVGKIIDSRLHQNENYGIRLGTSTVRVTIQNCDIESTGTFFPSGLGYGIALTGLARTVRIEGCWLEGNKVHIVVGPTDSTTQVPTNTQITNCQLWSTSGGGHKIRLNSGRDTLIENNEFFGGGDIYLNSLSGNPVIRNNLGNYRVIDSNGNLVSVGSTDMTNNFPYPEISTWSTMTNCTVTEEFIASPAGPVPVYKVTPTAPGFVRLGSPASVYSFLTKRQTIGLYIKTDGASQRSFYLAVTSIAIAKSYTSVEIDSFPVSNNWTWYSLGRHIDSSDTSGNQRFFLDVEVTTTDPFYVSGFVSLNGIVYQPYMVTQPFGIPALSNSATPSVYGLTNARTGGTTTITNFTGGALGQTFTLIAEHSITITDGTNIFLAGSANFAMNATDTLTLIRKADGKWYEIARSDNS